MIRRVLALLLGFVAAALVFTVLLYAVAPVLRPDVRTPPALPDQDEVARVTALRTLKLDKDNPPRIQVDVDYTEGPSASRPAAA